MGMSFECPRHCGNPVYDSQAKAVLKILEKTIQEVFEDRWSLFDKLDIWRSFDPYGKDIQGIDEEEGFVIYRYNWEKGKGVLVHSDRIGFYDKGFPDWDYVDMHIFDLTRSDIVREFSFLRRDLLFYATQREKYLQDRLTMHHENLVEIANLQKEFNAAVYDFYTDKVIGGGEWSFIYGAAHERHNNSDDTYSRQINYARKHEQEEIQQTIKRLKFPIYEECLDQIENAYEKIEDLLEEIFVFCLENHQSEGIEFQSAIDSLLVGDVFNGLLHLRKLVEIGEKNQYSAEIMGKIQLLKGRLESECMLYGDAIASLTEAIIKMPSLKEAYFDRAAAYFELGEFDLCLEDYLQSGIKPEYHESPELIAFSIGLGQGLLNGGAQAAVEFIPSLFSSIHGLTRGLWALAQDPIGVSSEFARAAHACIEFMKNHSIPQLVLELAPELQELVEKWDVLDDQKKGEIAGKVVGRYGVEIFAGGYLVKGVKLYRDLKRANNLLTFETIALSERHKVFIKAEALRKAESRKAVLQQANLKIHWGQQGKHIMSHPNYDISARRSILLHPKPEELIQKKAGTGTKIGKGEAGSLEFKEIVDFNEFIGYNVDFSTGEKTATSWGKVHYGKNGVHIVPTKPRINK